MRTFKVGFRNAAAVSLRIIVVQAALLIAIAPSVAHAKSSAKQWRATKKALIEVSRDRQTQKLLSFFASRNFFDVGTIELGRIKDPVSGDTRRMLLTDKGLYTEHVSIIGDSRFSITQISDVGTSLFPFHLKRGNAYKIKRADFDSLTAAEIKKNHARWLEQANERTAIIGN